MSNQTSWSIDTAHSDVSFKVRHLMISNVKGTFKTFDANIFTNGNDFSTAEIGIWLDPASVDTGNEKRDAHLIGPDFFDAVHHKQISFKSSTIGKANPNGNHELWGELTMMGITKNIKLNVQFGGISKDRHGNEKAGFTVSGRVNRSDWGLVWNDTLETGGLLLSDEVRINCEIELMSNGVTAPDTDKVAVA